MYAKPNTMAQIQLDPHDARRFELEALRVRVAADVATIGSIDLLGMRPQDCAVFLKAAASANALNIALNNDDFLAELGWASLRGDFANWNLKIWPPGRCSNFLVRQSFS